jgi:hypothetical protein
MRSTFILLVVSSTCAWAQPPPAATSSPDNKDEAARASEAATLTRKAEKAYKITLQGDGKAALTLEPKPLLQWSNPVLGSFHGSVFVWTAAGRPEVVASIYKKYVPPPHHLGVEFHSLAAGPLSAERDGHPEWFPESAGVNLKPIPDAAAPADSSAQRLRELRALAREFSAAKTDRKDVTRALRLLTQPIYRYQSTDPNLLDGALFAFVEGTDPEVFLLIEARRDGKGYAWQFAPARMNSIALRVSHRGREVWSVPTIPYQQAFNPREPYTLIIRRSPEDIIP